MPIAIYSINALSDNYIWAIVSHQSKKAILIDVGECHPALNFLHKYKLELDAIWITHHHNDHIGGVGELLSYYANAKLYAHVRHNLNAYNPILIDEGKLLTAFGHPVHIWATPGHTDTHLSFLLNYYNKTHVFCGDTLFRAGCGRVFTGTTEQLYHSFVRYNSLASDSIFYPAHEYTLNNLSFANSIEPNNKDILRTLIQDRNKQQNNQPTLPTLLEDERLINPFLRSIINPDFLIKNSTINPEFLSKETLSFDLFSHLRKLKNNF